MRPDTGPQICLRPIALDFDLAAELDNAVDRDTEKFRGIEREVRQ
jgi:hypothetical protein